MVKFFSLPGLGSVFHTNQTRKILENADNKSEFLRNAIIAFAENYGYLSNSDNGYMPESAIESLKHLKTKSRYIDYDYIAAFWWLKSLTKYKFHSKSELLRIIICDQPGQ